MSEVPIYNEELIEFEYDNFSVFHDPVRDIWFLETYEDEDNITEIVIEDLREKIEFSKELLKDINFTEEEFLKLKIFLKEKK
jgi:hypothetical protein